MKWVEYIANIIFWMATGWIISVSFSIQGHEIEIVNDIQTIRTVRDEGLMFQLVHCICISMPMFYANLYNLNKLEKSSSRIKTFIISSLIFLLSILIFNVFEPLLFDQEFLLPLPFSIGIFSFYFAISTTYGLVKIWISSEQRQKDLILANKQAELNLLRNQLQPHFLFNALNNLLYLVDQKQSPQLAHSFEKLSNLLRYVIQENKSEKVSVALEIEFVRNYCDLQLLRFEDGEVNIDFSVEGNCSAQLVEPGLFIPFVENAFKYGTEPEAHSSIKIRFDVNNPNQIVFTVENEKIDVFGKVESTGLGIKSTKERLKLVYPHKHTLKISEDDSFIAELRINTI